MKPPRLYRVTRGGKQSGNLLAQFRDGGRVVSWSTGTLDRKVAAARAEAEIARRSGAVTRPEPTPDPTRRAISAPPLAPRPPLGEALARAFGGAQLGQKTESTGGGGGEGQSNTGGAGTTHDSAATATVPDGAPAGRPGPDVVPANPPSDEATVVPRRLYKIGARAATSALEGLLQRAVRFAGREPAEMDDDERDLVREGFEEQFRIWFGTTSLTPGGKIALGALLAGAGMYQQGTPIAKTPTPPQLTPAERDTPPAPARVDEAA